MLWFSVVMAGIVARSPRPLPVTEFRHEHVRQQLVPHPIQHHVDPFGGLQVITIQMHTEITQKPSCLTLCVPTAELKWGVDR